MKKILAVALLSTVALGCSSVNLNRESKSTKYSMSNGMQGGMLTGLYPEMKRIPHDITGEERLSFMVKPESAWNIGGYYKYIGQAYYDLYMKDKIGTGATHWILNKRTNLAIRIEDMGSKEVPTAIISLHEYEEGDEADARKLNSRELINWTDYTSSAIRHLPEFK